MQRNWQKGTQQISKNISHGIELRQERRQNFSNNLTNAWNNAANNRQQRRENRANTINKAYHNTIDNTDNRRHNRADNINQALNHHGGHGNNDCDDYYDDSYYGYNDHWHNHWQYGTNVVVAINPGVAYYTDGYATGYYGQTGAVYTGTCTYVVVQPGYWMNDAWGNSIYVNPRIGRVCR